MRNKMRNRKEWKAMNNEVVKKPRGPKAFFKKVYRYRQFLIMLAPAVIYTLVLRIIQWRVLFWHLRSTLMPAVSGEVHGTDLKISISFLNLVRHGW